MRTQWLARLGAVVFGLVVCAGPALATWSIVVVNRVTGEVCVASATCIGNKFPLKVWLPVIAVEKGGGVAQSAVDSTGGNRLVIWNGLQAGLAPARILDQLSKNDGWFQQRQYGIVDFNASPITFTGSQAGKACLGVVGEVGDLVYAVQGNVLAGDEVVLETEKTLRAAAGDLSQRVMAAMETARLWGGDGRCSCSSSDPPGCGSPPPSFTHSAYTAFIVLARPGDVDGVCNPSVGCASGNYYLSTVFKGKGASDPDPVQELTQRYNQWRTSMAGVPDHYSSAVQADRDSLVADGLSSARISVKLADVDGVPLTTGGHSLRVRRTSPGGPTARPGPITDHGDGTYSFSLTATSKAGRSAFQIEVDTKGPRSILLRPQLVMETSPRTDLHLGVRRLSASAGGMAPFTVNRGSAEAGRTYRILGGHSGNLPGFDFGGVHVPLNRDAFFNFTWSTTGSDSAFMGSAGVLDGVGRATADLVVPAGAWSALAGRRFDFCALLGATATTGVAVTPLVSFRLDP